MKEDSAVPTVAATAEATMAEMAVPTVLIVTHAETTTIRTMCPNVIPMAVPAATTAQAPRATTQKMATSRHQLSGTRRAVAHVIADTGD